MTILKAQGLTIREGTIIDLQTRSGRQPASDMGTACVAWTRAPSFDLWAIRGLPSLQAFDAQRRSQLFAARQVFETWADERHEQTMLKRGFTPEQEVMAHLKHLQAQRAAEGKLATDEELDDIRMMLGLRGLRPRAPCVIKHLEALLGSNTGKLEAGCGRKRRKIRFGTSTEKLRRAGRIQAHQKQKAPPTQQPMATDENCTIEMDCTDIFSFDRTIGGCRCDFTDVFRSDGVIYIGPNRYQWVAICVAVE